MLIDWLTLKLPFDCLSAAQIHAVEWLSDRIQRYCPKTGEVLWETGAWESVRSDSHQLAMKGGADCLRIQGSPARCMGDGCAVFGAAGRALNVKACVTAMLDFAARALGEGPFCVPFGRVQVRRIDLAGNLALDDVSQVRQGLRYLRETEGGRYRVSQVAGDSVYWSHRSRLRSGKAYGKWAQLLAMMKRPGYSGRRYTVDELEAAKGLLRLELKLGPQFIHERAQVRWYEMDEAYLKGQWVDYFNRMVGDVSVVDESAVRDLVLKAAQAIEDERAIEQGRAVRDASGQGRAAFLTWCMIKAEGWQWARDNSAKATWHRHIKVLREAGLGDLDISTGQVSAIRRRQLTLSPVSSWAELMKAA